MPQLIVRTRDGTEHEVAGEAGLSVMEVIRDNGFDELLAMCGGSCSCATCHVYVDEDQLDCLGPLGPDEHELLDSSEHRSERSRLSCQLRFDGSLDGLRITIAPED
ncbi:2Fe-2S iron-sulfur cluster-binding protein [Sphingomonas sp. IC-11]|uniref:2Fe-2S iron-sulfur cluster-binding protein n=1 Tax=Sphingomonas sp. IC-11 TaxID=2898528 RepID=UPI001E3347F3|nr:2Fe-2S iron-sulfur cluster-binding protein [Sphingomonas sp. IC-11]MCD2316278.1 2Fe-2S iron-sulfur cluster-binding protein [Sphingomonas sp. IC-11]